MDAAILRVEDPNHEDLPIFCGVEVHFTLFTGIEHELVTCLHYP